ncbi:MAG: dihydropteroate synthase, partial [Microlunatus sp.]
MTYLPPIRQPIRSIGGREFDFARQIVIMGIVNRTPDSFYDQGATYALERAVEAGRRAVAEGAGWVDVGGVPFSPDVPKVPAAEELDRVVPVAAALAEDGVVVSVDTVRSSVAQAAIDVGAGVINDTSGLHDPELADVVAGSTASLVITHSLAPPGEHLRRPRYDDVVSEIRAFLESRIELALAHGVPEERIVIDPGHDLNKNTRHSLEITRRLSELADLGLPLLAAVSNKDFIGEAVGLERGERLEASLAAATACALQGARILRMHQVRESVRAARMVETI